MHSTKHLLQLPGHTEPSPIHLTADVDDVRNGLPNHASLNLLSIVDVAQIPLHVILGPRYSVNTECRATQQYLESTLLANGGSTRAWWQTAQPESPLGVLASVEGNAGNESPRITELLLVASKSLPKHPQRLPTPPSSSPPEYGDSAGHSQSAPSLRVCAIALSSDLLYAAEAPSPPSSPIPDDTDIIPAIFLPDSFPAPSEIIHNPPIKKRRTATSTLDEATERRKAARRAGGESISAAAALQTDAPPPLTHRRSTSGSGPVPLQTRPLSRSPSLASSRPGSVRGPTPAEPARRSTLNHVENTAALPTDEEALVAKNKDVIMRIVMAGMRVHGLSQSKKKTSKHRPSLPDTAYPTLEVSVEDVEAEKRQDEEYKGIYHQVHKSVCFTFRAHMRVASLTPHTEALRDTVDKLLGVFCADPLAEGLVGGQVDKLTPGGRKAFGSAKAVEEKSPFAVA